MSDDFAMESFFRERRQRKVEQLQGVSYERRADGKHEIGVIAEDVARILPEIVAQNPDTRQIEGVDYSRLTALLIEAIKSQQVEIQQLQIEILQIKSRGGDGGGKLASRDSIITRSDTNDTWNEDNSVGRFRKALNAPRVAKPPKAAGVL